MDGDLLMYLRAARSMAAFVGWCDGGSTDDGCAAASMDETTINSLHMLHQHNYDTGKALQALVKIINPKSVDKRWSDDDSKKFVRGLKQHGKNFFKIRKDLLPYKDVASLVEYYYLWKKTPAAFNTRPHRRHRRPAFRRQAPTPTLPQGDDLDELSSASEASDNDSDDECQPNNTNNNNNNNNNDNGLSINVNNINNNGRSDNDKIDFICYRCSTTKSNTWHEVTKDNFLCKDCHRSTNRSNSISQVDEEAPPSCDLIGGEDDITQSTMEEDTPPFMFRPVKNDIEHKLALSSNDNNKSNIVKEESKYTNDTTATKQEADEDVKQPMAYPARTSDVKTENQAFIKKEEKVDISEEQRMNQWSKPITSSSTSSSFFVTSNSFVYSPPSLMSSFTPIQPSSKSFSSTNLPKNQQYYSSIQPQKPSAYVPSSSSSSTLPDTKPHRAIASVAPTIQDALSTQQTQPSSFFSGSFVSSSSYPPPPSSSSLLSTSYTAPHFTSNFVHTTNNNTLDLSTNQSVLTTSNKVSSTNTPSTQSSYSPYPVNTLSYPPYNHLPFFASQTSNNMPEDMSIKRKRVSTPKNTSTNNNNTNSLNNGYSSSSTSNTNISQNNKGNQQQKPSQPQQEEIICHNISDDDDEEDNANADLEFNRTPSPDPIACNEQAYASTNSLFTRKWNRGNNSCSRCDLTFSPHKNSKWYHRREEKLHYHGKSSHNSHHHHHHHKSHHQSVLKDARRSERKDDDKTKSPMSGSRSTDAQITSSLMGSGHHMTPFSGASDRLSSRGGGIFHDPTPALSQLSAYARPHIGNQRCYPNMPPSRSMDYFRMPGVFPPSSRDVMDIESDKHAHAWDIRELRERELRELEFMEKMKQEMELKSAAVAAAGGFDRLPHLPGSAVDSMLLDMRRIMPSPLALSAGASSLSSLFAPPTPGNLSAELLQRERLEQLSRSSQDPMAAIARETALLYQRYTNDPGMLRHLNAFLANKAPEKSDPLASGVSQPSMGAGSSTTGLPSSHLPPPPGLHHQNHPLFAALSRDPERIYMELLSRPPYNSDPLLAQQVLGSAVVAAQQEMQRHLMDRDYGGNPMLP